MEKESYLYQMCQELLTQTDINAIGKSRGFSSVEIASRASLQNFFLSSAGIQQALATLTEAEIALLHLLHAIDKPVDITIFERLYNPKVKSSFYSSHTFTQRYQPVFKQVHTNLVRKGILIMGQIKQLDATKMEQYRFLFPSEFASYLPLPVEKIVQLATPGEVRHDVVRNKLLALTGQAKEPGSPLAQYELELANGRLTIGKRPFKVTELEAWQKASWQKAMAIGQEQAAATPKQEQTFTSEEALNYMLARLKPNEWVAPQQLTTTLKIFCRPTLDADEVCHLGWTWGFLARNGIAKQPVYRLAALPSSDDVAVAPPDYLSATSNQMARVNLRTIPPMALEQLSQIADLTVQKGELTAVSNLISMSTAPASLFNTPLFTWLIKHIPAFAQTYKTIKARQGKQILHTNLHIAQVKDLTLRVRLERALKPHELIVLADEYIAFPPKLLSKVTQIVSQAGHIVKHADPPK